MTSNGLLYRIWPPKGGNESSIEQMRNFMEFLIFFYKKYIFWGGDTTFVKVLSKGSEKLTPPILGTLSPPFLVIGLVIIDYSSSHYAKIDLYDFRSRKLKGYTDQTNILPPERTKKIFCDFFTQFQWKFLKIWIFYHFHYLGPFRDPLQIFPYNWPWIPSSNVQNTV